MYMSSPSHQSYPQDVCMCAVSAYDGQTYPDKKINALNINWKQVRRIYDNGFEIQTFMMA